MTIEISPLRRFSISAEAFKGLPLEHQYCASLLGHVFNEVMALQRLVLLSGVPAAADEATKAGAVFHLAMFTKLLAGKLFEAHKKVNSVQMKEFFGKYYFSLSEENVKALKSFNARASGCKWLNAARNRHAMHYATLADYSASSSPSLVLEPGFQVILGNTFGETLYQTADLLEGVAFFGSALPGKSLTETINAIVEDLSDIAQLLLEVIQGSMSGFLTNTGAIEEEPLETMPAIVGTGFHLPYFIRLERD